MILKHLKVLTTFKTISILENPQEFSKLYDYVDQNLSSLKLVTKEYKKDQYISKFWGTVENPDLLLTAHIDVVPAEDSMFQPIEKNGKLSGRGVLDMKFALALFIDLFNNIENLNDYSIGILLTPDEETGGFDGTKYVLDHAKLTPKVVLLPDGGAQMSIENAEKGILHAKITAKGKSAHGSRPWLGVNAIDKLIKTYQKIKDIFPTPKTDEWLTTLNAGKISGGTATNVVPDQATLELDFRVISEDDRKYIKQVLAKLSEEPDIKAEVLVEGPSFELDKDNSYLNSYLDTAEKITGHRPPLIPSAGSSDARFFSEINIPVIISRPKGEGHHADYEWIDLKSLEIYAQIVTEFAKQFKI